VLVGGLLHPPGGELEVVAAPLHRPPFEQVLHLQREGGDLLLLVLDGDPHQEGGARVDGAGQAALDVEVAQAQLGEHAAGQDQRQHHPEDQEEEVDPAVDGRHAHQQGGAQEPPPLARRGEAARWAQEGPEAR
jgi:hypothetical protein